MIYHPPPTNREGRVETAEARTTASAPEQQRRQAAQAEPWFASLQSTNLVREALMKVRPDLLSWEIARSVSHSNDNFQIIAKMIEQGGRGEKLWQHGEHGEYNLSVFTARNLPGTYTAHV